MFYSWLSTKIKDYNDAKKKGQPLYTILRYVEKYIIEENFDFSKVVYKKLVGLTFDRALEKNIYEFDSITYRLPNQDALSFWQSVGAEVSGLYHIEGNIEQMEQIISEKTGPRKK